jgi:transcriptional regulator with XRE-family HTH domain
MKSSHDPKPPSKDELLHRIAQNIRKIRLLRGLTQEQMIEDLNFHLISYQRIESKNPPNIRIYNLYQIAKVLKVSIDSLLQP